LAESKEGLFTALKNQALFLALKQQLPLEQQLSPKPRRRKREVLS